VATGNFWDGFRRWRRSRPFWGSLFLLLSGLEMFYTANSSIGGVKIHIGPTGFLSYVLPLVLVAAAILCLFSPAQRLFYGVIGICAALYSFIGLNLGGLLLGMLLGILGGALVIAWGPPRVAPGAGLTDPPADGEPAAQHDEPYEQHPADIDTTQQIDIAGHDDRPEHEPVRPATQEAHPRGFLPGFTDEEPPRGPSRFGRNPKALAILLIPLAVTATMLVAGSRAPASADETCPEGLPSRSYATSAPASASAASASAASAKKKAAVGKSSAAVTRTSAAARKKAVPKAGTKGTKAAATTSPSASSTASSASSSSASSSSAEEDDGIGGAIGGAIVDGISDVVDGVGNLLGIGGEESPSPSASPSPSVTPAESPSASPSASASASPSASTSASTPASASASAPPSASASATTSSAAALPTASGDVIPCLGPRVVGKVAGSDDIPQVANKPGLMEVEKLELYNSTYDGVADMPTAKGSYKALKFTMKRAVNTPFSLTIDEPTGGTTKITSANLETVGDVKFYTSQLKGKLFGLIPVTFTPDSPPPLTLPYLSFTDVTIQLAYVRCNTLTGDPLKIAEIS
jgi:uncharacterized protein DUF6114